MNYFYYRQKGMTFLEVVISMLLIGIAIVGSIAMLQTSVKYNQNANNQSMALYIAQEVIGKMQSNMAAAKQYTGTWGVDAVRNGAGKSQKCFEALNTSKPCTDQDWAQDDLIGIYKDLILMLPSPSISITALSASFPNNSYEVQISWSDTDVLNGERSSPANTDGLVEQTVVIPFTL